MQFISVFIEYYILPVKQVFSLGCFGSRPAKPEKREFAIANDHFKDKYNEEIELYKQTH